MCFQLINSIERQSIRAFVAFVTKLSESTFTPLFRRLQDWAWTSENITTGKRIPLATESYAFLHADFAQRIS